MAIRVHKFLGYGLDDIQAADYRISDPRINSDSSLLSSNASGDNLDEQLDVYADWLSEHSLETVDINGQRHRMSFDLDCLNHRQEEQARYPRRRGLSDCLAYQAEYGLNNVLVLQPWGCADWSRYDDPIDWMSEAYPSSGDTPQADRIKIFTEGIYPFTLHMDKRSGEVIKAELLRSWSIIEQLRADKPELADAVAERAGFTDYAEAQENIVPRVPNEIRDLIRYSELFTNDDVWLQLRPMLYTYWA